MIPVAICLHFLPELGSALPGATDLAGNLVWPTSVVLWLRAYRPILQ
jgi:hypothetical protein